MSLQSKLYKLKGKVQHYAWGGFNFIPELLHYPNPDNKPCAEYWMGAHPSASSVLLTENGEVNLNQLIKESPAETITTAVNDKFGELPYLFKLLDVHEMLSIQVHPTKSEAVKGFEAEEAAGVPINAPNRNYKDKNHKPEVMVALSEEFWLLHGFKPEQELADTLSLLHEFNVLLPLFKRDGYKGLYQYVMEMPQEDADSILASLVKKEVRRKLNNELSKDMPGWWVAKLYENTDNYTNLDRGIFSIYFFNIVRIGKGEAIFQGAGIPHAYLEGQNAELMANSDNVLRGGLTPKHVDVPELMKHTLFQGIHPNVMKGKHLGAFDSMERNYPCPVPDFGINKIELNADNKYSEISTSFEIIIATEGGVVVNGSNNQNIVIKAGEVFAVLPGESYSITSSGHSVLFKAFVPAIAEQ